MASIHKNYGFKIEVIDVLDPIKMEAYKKEAQKIINMYDFNDINFKCYDYKKYGEQCDE